VTAASTAAAAPSASASTSTSTSTQRNIRTGGLFGSTQNSASRGVGGMPFSPEQMQNILSDPAAQSLVNSPGFSEMLRGMIQSNPQLRQLADSNPQFAQALNDPEVF
jgi:hypothetical protein